MTTPSTPITRRRVVQGIAWSTPAIAATVAAPAFAASNSGCDTVKTWARYADSISASIDAGVRTGEYPRVEWTINTNGLTTNATFQIVAISVNGARQEKTAENVEPGRYALMSLYDLDIENLARLEFHRVTADEEKVNIYELDTRSCAIIPTRSDMGKPFTPPADCDLRASWDEFLSRDHPDTAYTYDPVARALTVVRFPSAKPLPNELPVASDTIDVVYTPRDQAPIRGESISIVDGDLSGVTFPLDYPLEDITDLRIVRQQLFNDKESPDYRWAIPMHTMRVGAFSCNVTEGFLEGAFVNREPWGIF